MEIRRIEKDLYASIKQYRKLMLENNSRFDGCFELDKYEDMEKWHLNLQLFESEETLPPLYSRGYEYAFVDNNEVIGLINFRPDALNHPYLKQFGGHIGYSIRPDKRKLGYGSKILKMFLDVVKKEYDLDQVLITCNESNIGSAKIIENNGGIYEGSIFCPSENENLRRYWIKLS